MVSVGDNYSCVNAHGLRLGFVGGAVSSYTLHFVSLGLLTVYDQIVASRLADT